MKRAGQILFLTFITCINISCQVNLIGEVRDIDGLPLPGANVMIKGTYDGTTTDSTGTFSFATPETGKQILIASFIGYKTAEKEIDLPDLPRRIEIILEVQLSEITGVVISAGAFETGELKRPIVLKPMDIATTPGALGDIHGAMTTLPGTQVVGSEGGLYVRGEKGYEAKTFIDDMQVASPKTYYNPSLPYSQGDRTSSYNDLSINITCIRPIFGSYCAILFNISNLLGFENIYGYHYSLNPDAGGNYTCYPIIPQSKRFFILGGYFIF